MPSKTVKTYCRFCHAYCPMEATVEDNKLIAIGPDYFNELLAGAHDMDEHFRSASFDVNMPVILGPDGPSLGGFVCPCCVAAAELWKVGQLKPGDTVRFHAITQDRARQLESAQDAAIADLEGELSSQILTPDPPRGSAISKRLPGEPPACPLGRQLSGTL